MEWTALTVRANLTAAGETGRHALRLAAVTGVAELVVQAGGLIAFCFVVVGILAATFGAALETTLSSGYTIAQYFGWDPILSAAAYRIGEGIWTIVRPPGTFGYVSYFATWLLMAGFLCLSLRTIAGVWHRSTSIRVATFKDLMSNSACHLWRYRDASSPAGKAAGSSRVVTTTNDRVRNPGLSTRTPGPAHTSMLIQ